jgi:O-antigen ligase
VFQYLTGTFDNNYGGFALSLEHQIIGTIDDYRSTGPMGDPNYFAQIMVVLIPIALERFLHEKKNSLRLIALWSFAVSVLTVMFTYSRGGFLAMVIGVILVLIYYPPKQFQIPVIIISVIVFISLLPPNYLDRLSTLTDLFQPRGTLRIEERSLQGRLSENLAALEMIKANPLFGVGLNSYKYLFPVYSKRLGLALVATEREAHNLFLEVAAETGVIGFSVFIFVLFVCLQVMFRGRNSFNRSGMDDYSGMITGFLGGFIAYFVASVFIHNAFPRYFYLLIGLALSIRLVVQNTIMLRPKSE